MSKRQPEEKRYSVDLQTPRRRELFSPISEQRRRSTFVRNDGESHAIELNENDDMVVVLERGGPDYSEGAVLISDADQQTGTAFTLWKNGDNDILFIDPVYIDPEPSAEEDFDRWEVVRQEDQADQASFTSEGFAITDNNGYIAGVDSGSPFALEFDSDNTPVKCHTWDEQKRKWCCLVQPLNPDYVTYLLTKATTISSAQPELRDRLSAVTVGHQEVKQLNPVLARMKEEASRRNRGHKWGRELTAQLSEHALKRDNKLTPPPVWRMHGKDSLMEHLPRIKGELPGLKDMQFIWGTSFCRADIKEVIQYFSLSKALEAEGKTGMKAAYFIDANAHTTGELLEATARDFNLDEQELIQTLDLQPRPLPLDYPTQHMTGEMVRMSNNLLLPPAFYDAPDANVFDSLNNASMGEVLDIWRAAALETQGQSFGDWRIAVDRLSIRRLAEKMGVDPDFIQVVSMTDIINAVPNMTTRHVTTAVEDMWTRIKPEVQKGLMGEMAEDVDNEDMPMVFRLVLPDGRRIGINTQFRPIDLATREEVTDVPFAQEVSAAISRQLGYNQSLSSHTIQEAFSRYPMQFSGLGYYLFTKVMAESNLNAAQFPRMNQISMIIDDYEQSVGPTAAGVALREREAVVPLSMPKGLVGIRTDRQIDFDTTPDVSTLLALPDSELSHVSTFIESTATTLRSDDIGSATGLVIDMRAGQVSEVTRIASRRQMLAISGTENNGVGAADINTSELSYAQERFLPPALMALRPENTNTVLTGYIGTHDNVTAGMQVLDSAIIVGDKLGVPVPPQARLYHHLLTRLDALLTTGEEIAEEIEHKTLSPEEWILYWQNNIKAQTIAAVESGLGVIGVSADTIRSMEGARDYAQSLNVSYRSIAEDQIVAGIRSERSEYVVSLNQTVQETERLLREYQALQQFNGLLGRLGNQGITPGELVRSVNASSKDFKVVEAMVDAYTAQKQAALTEVSQQGKKAKQDKVRVLITPEDIQLMLSQARTAFTGSFERLQLVIPAEKPITEAVKENGRLHPDTTRHLDVCRQRVADVVLMADVTKATDENLRIYLDSGVPAELRQQLKAEWEGRLHQLVSERMVQYNDALDRHWKSLNQQTQVGGTHLQTKLDRKLALEDRIHFEVIQPKTDYEDQLKALYLQVQTEYRTWWNSVAKGLLKQGFPVSGNAN